MLATIALVLYLLDYLLNFKETYPNFNRKKTWFARNVNSFLKRTANSKWFKNNKKNTESGG